MITKKSGRGRQRGTGLPMETLIHMKVTREMYDESKAVATANCLPLTGWIR